MKKRFKEGDMVPMFKSKLRLFMSKLQSQWTGPFQVAKVFPHGAVEMWSESVDLFKVNGKRFKPYFVGEPIEKVIIHTLTNPIQG